VTEGVDGGGVEGGDLEEFEGANRVDDLLDLLLVGGVGSSSYIGFLIYM
jgi:hypothetical protein